MLAHQNVINYTNKKFVIPLGITSKLLDSEDIFNKIEIIFFRNRKCIKNRKSVNKPPFMFKKADEELLARKPQGMLNGSSGSNCRW